jgi:hypothetical protein
MTVESNSDNQTHYQRLGISPDDDLTDAYIKLKFRTAALKLHPDKETLSDSANSDSMALLIEARDTLLDPDKRAIYNEKIFGDPDFVEHVKETISSAQRGLREPAEEYSPAFYRLKNYCYITAINCCYYSIENYGYNSDDTRYISKLLEGLDASFFRHPNWTNYCSDMYLTIATHFIEPVEKQVKALKSSSDMLCQIKASQLEYFLEEINEAVFYAHFEGTKEMGESDCKAVPMYSQTRTARQIYKNLHDVLSDCAEKKEINFHRNLIVDSVKALTGALVILLTLLPSIGLALFSKTYRNAIHTTFFATKSRACLENADTSLYKLAKSKDIL